MKSGILYKKKETWTNVKPYARPLSSTPPPMFSPGIHSGSVLFAHLHHPISLYQQLVPPCKSGSGKPAENYDLSSESSSCLHHLPYVSFIELLFERVRIMRFKSPLPPPSPIKHMALLFIIIKRQPSSPVDTCQQCSLVLGRESQVKKNHLECDNYFPNLNLRWDLEPYVNKIHHRYSLTLVYI